jgi:hypothetical protein
MFGKSRGRPRSGLWMVVCCAALVWVGGCAQDQTLTDAQRMKIASERKAIVQKPRRMIFNNDGGDMPRGPETAQQFLAKRMAGLVDTQVDSIFYSTPYSYQVVTAPLVDKDGNPTNKDTLDTAIEFAHAYKKELFWSMRMNDSADSSLEGGLKLNPWKIDYRANLMAPSHMSFPYGWVNRPSWPWSAMNYENVEVRAHVFDVIATVCNRYDVDGIELDFWRWPVFFRPQLFGQPVTQAHCDMMTDLLRQVRAFAELQGHKRGRPILIAVRIPDSVWYAKQVGLDVIQWLDEDLVDMLIGGEYFQLQPWDHLVRVGKHYNAPVYACLSRSRIPDDAEAFRGEALTAWEAGVSGIYTFNDFNVDSPRFRELGDPKLLQTLPRKDKYKLGYLEWMHNQWVGTLLKDGQRFYDKKLMAKWEEPLPQIFDGINVGFEPGRNLSMVYTTDRYKLSFVEREGRYELYDILTDPHERTDLAAKMPEVFVPMKEKFDLWRQKNASILFNP